MRGIKDVGILPEPEMQARSAASTPYEMGHDPKRFAYPSIKQAADRAASGNPADLPQLRKDLASEDSGVRYWAATGILIRKEKAVTAAAAELTRALEDQSPSVRIAAAEALGRYGTPDAQASALKTLIALGSVGKNGFYVSNLAWDALDHLPTDLVRSSRAAIEALDYGGQPDVAVSGRGGRGPVLREGSFDLFGAGVEDEAVRAAGSAASMRATILAKLR
jgi:uncharacterized sulfatase